MKIKSIFLAIAAIAFIGMTSFTIMDNNPNANKSENQITISLQSGVNRVPIVWGGKTVGYLEWSVLSYTQWSDSGGMIKLYLYNDSDEWINVSITGKRANSCTSTGWRLRPYQKNNEVTFSCSEQVSDFSFLITVED